MKNFFTKIKKLLITIFFFNIFACDISNNENKPVENLINDFYLNQDQFADIADSFTGEYSNIINSTIVDPDHFSYSSSSISLSISFKNSIFKEFVFDIESIALLNDEGLIHTIYDSDEAGKPITLNAAFDIGRAELILHRADIPTGSYKSLHFKLSFKNKSIKFFKDINTVNAELVAPSGIILSKEQVNFGNNETLSVAIDLATVPIPFVENGSIHLDANLDLDRSIKPMTTLAGLIDENPTPAFFFAPAIDISIDKEIKLYFIAGVEELINDQLFLESRRLKHSERYSRYFSALPIMTTEFTDFISGNKIQSKESILPLLQNQQGLTFIEGYIDKAESFAFVVSSLHYFAFPSLFLGRISKVVDNSIDFYGIKYSDKLQQAENISKFAPSQAIIPKRLTLFSTSYQDHNHVGQSLIFSSDAQSVQHNTILLETISGLIDKQDKTRLSNVHINHLPLGRWANKSEVSLKVPSENVGAVELQGYFDNQKLAVLENSKLDESIYSLYVVPDLAEQEHKWIARGEGNQDKSFKHHWLSDALAKSNRIRLNYDDQETYFYAKQTGLVVNPLDEQHKITSVSLSNTADTFVLEAYNEVFPTRMVFINKEDWLEAIQVRLAVSGQVHGLYVVGKKLADTLLAQQVVVRMVGLDLGAALNYFIFNQDVHAEQTYNGLTIAEILAIGSASAIVALLTAFVSKKIVDYKKSPNFITNEASLKPQKLLNIIPVPESFTTLKAYLGFRSELTRVANFAQNKFPAIYNSPAFFDAKNISIDSNKYSAIAVLANKQLTSLGEAYYTESDGNKEKLRKLLDLNEQLEKLYNLPEYDRFFSTKKLKLIKNNSPLNLLKQHAQGLDPSAPETNAHRLYFGLFNLDNAGLDVVNEIIDKSKGEDADKKLTALAQLLDFDTLTNLENEQNDKNNGVKNQYIEKALANFDDTDKAKLKDLLGLSSDNQIKLNSENNIEAKINQVRNAYAQYERYKTKVENIEKTDFKADYLENNKDKLKKVEAELKAVLPANISVEEITLDDKIKEYLGQLDTFKESQVSKINESLIKVKETVDKNKTRPFLSRNSQGFFINDINEVIISSQKKQLYDVVSTTLAEEASKALQANDKQYLDIDQLNKNIKGIALTNDNFNQVKPFKDSVKQGLFVDKKPKSSFFNRFKK